MKLYKLSQECNDDYDTYDSIIVCAENELEAVKIHPEGDKWVSYKDGQFTGHTCAWVEYTKDIKCELIGIADEKYTKSEVILASFNAG